ncbi:hypothetical protein NQ317_019018 [Molorchus minor]|uniref:Dynein intermediate chain 3, ciliary n=1 Tax=Molorchus minor TaxID=1323400 RepID=A0ABQ9J512_9CUCU|nr:hypothetical protein NQ317_019018 [Molorchus minor]
MDVTYIYQKKKRSEFGRQCLFSDRGPELIDNYPSDKKLYKDYIFRDPVHRGMLCAPVYAEHYLNTIRAEFVNSGMNHIEDEEQVKRYRRKIEKDDNYPSDDDALFKSMEDCILQNNAINIYQHYFVDVEPTPMVEKSSARTVNVYQDQCNPTRPVSHMSWSPDNQTKIAATYCNLVFQGPKTTTDSYIWEVENPNAPLMTLKPEFPMVCLEYNPKDPHSLVSGQENGQVAVWDIRKGEEPVELSVVESSFRDPVHNVLWIHSKTGTEFFSSSTDGQVKWWDTRKLSEPTETLILDYAKDEMQSMEKALGASCLEYENTIPTRFMVGTEKGVIISCNRKGKTAMEKMAYRLTAHLGPVLALQRNPGFIKNFLSIGDWTAKIWSEDCRESSIMWTSFHKTMLTDGAWSPTRQVKKIVNKYQKHSSIHTESIVSIFTTRADGILDVWDILQQQRHAIGNQKGGINLVEFTENLAVCNKNDKALLNGMFERESHREKILEARNRELRLKLKQEQEKGEEEDEEGHADAEAEMDENVFTDHYVVQSEAEFYEIIQKEIAKNNPTEEVEHEEVEEEEIVEEPVRPEPEPLPPTPVPEPEAKKEKKKEKGERKRVKVVFKIVELVVAVVETLEHIYSKVIVIKQKWHMCMPGPTICCKQKKRFWILLRMILQRVLEKLHVRSRLLDAIRKGVRDVTPEHAYLDPKKWGE